MRNYLTLGALAGPLPNNIIDGMVADAAPVMANMNSIIDNVNNNIGNYSYQVPLTGFSIVMADDTPILLLDPAGTLAAGTIFLPTTRPDGFVVTIASTAIVTALSMPPSGTATIWNPATALAAGIGVRFLYRLTNNTWYRLA